MKIFIFSMVGIVALCLLLPGCSKQARPIAYRVDECVFCKMKIMDPRFGSQLINTKGKHFNFDDVSCLVAYQGTGFIKEEEVAAIYVPDYLGHNILLAAEQMLFVHGEAVRSPMAGNIAAFAVKDSAIQAAGRLDGKLLNWKQVVTMLNE